MGLLRKNWRRNSLFLLLNGLWVMLQPGSRCWRKRSTVKSNYIKWTRLKMERVCFKSGPLQVTKHSFYLAKCNVSSAAVLGLRLLQTKNLYQQSVFGVPHSSDTGDVKWSPTVSALIWSEVELGVRLSRDWGDYFPSLNFRTITQQRQKLPPRLLHNQLCKILIISDNGGLDRHVS